MRPLGFYASFGKIHIGKTHIGKTHIEKTHNGKIQIYKFVLHW